MSNKFSSKKKRQINKSKQKISIREIKARKIIISSLNSFDKKKLPISILAIKKLNFKAKNANITMVKANQYYIVCYLKKAQVFAISIKNIQYQAKIEIGAKIDLKSIIP